MKERKVKSLSCVRLFATPWTVAYQDPLSMGFSRQEQIGKGVHQGCILSFPLIYCKCLASLNFASLSHAHACFITQSRPAVRDLLDCIPPGSFVHGIFQAGILEWVAISFFRGSSQPRDQPVSLALAGRFFCH